MFLHSTQQHERKEAIVHLFMIIASLVCNTGVWLLERYGIHLLNYMNEYDCFEKLKCRVIMFLHAYGKILWLFWIILISVSGGIYSWIKLWASSVKTWKYIGSFRRIKTGYEINFTPQCWPEKIIELFEYIKFVC